MQRDENGTPRGAYIVPPRPTGGPIPAPPLGAMRARRGAPRLLTGRAAPPQTRVAPARQVQEGTPPSPFAAPAPVPVFARASLSFGGQGASPTPSTPFFGIRQPFGAGPSLPLNPQALPSPFPQQTGGVAQRFSLQPTVRGQSATAAAAAAATTVTTTARNAPRAAPTQERAAPTSAYTGPSPFGLLPYDVIADILTNMLETGEADAVLRLCNTNQDLRSLCRSVRVNPQRIGLTVPASAFVTLRETTETERPTRLEKLIAIQQERARHLGRRAPTSTRRGSPRGRGRPSGTGESARPPAPTPVNPTLAALAGYIVGYQNPRKCVLWAWLLAAQSTLDQDAPTRPNVPSYENRRERLIGGVDIGRVSTNDLLLWATSDSIASMPPYAQSILTRRTAGLPYFWRRVRVLLGAPSGPYPYGMNPVLYRNPRDYYAKMVPVRIDPDIFESVLRTLNSYGQLTGALSVSPPTDTLPTDVLGSQPFMPPRFVTRLARIYRKDVGGTWLPEGTDTLEVSQQSVFTNTPEALTFAYTTVIGALQQAVEGTVFEGTGCVQRLFALFDVRLYVHYGPILVQYFAAIVLRPDLDIAQGGIDYWAAPPSRPIETAP